MVNVVIAPQHFSFWDETSAKNNRHLGFTEIVVREARRWVGLDMDLLTTQARRFLVGAAVLASWRSDLI